MSGKQCDVSHKLSSVDSEVVDLIYDHSLLGLQVLVAEDLSLLGNSYVLKAVLEFLISLKVFALALLEESLCKLLKE